MTGTFAQTLSRLRSEAGWRTGYEFYHRNGGRRTFPFSYPYYARLERGTALPRPEWIPRIFAQLRLPPSERARRDLVVGYLRDVIGDEPLFVDLVAPLLRPPEAEPPQGRVINRLLANNSYHCSLEQFRAILSSSAAYWAQNCLLNSHRPLSLDELAQATGFREAELRPALKVLAANGLARATPSEKYASPLVGRYCVYPRAYPGYDKDLARLKSFNELMIARAGQTLLDTGIVIRSQPAHLAEIRASLKGAVDHSSASSVYESREGTGLYAIEARIRRVFRF